MQFLTIEETIERFSSVGLYVDLSEEWYRRELGFEHPDIDKQFRIGCCPPQDTSLMWFAHQLASWLPQNTSRLLWISHWEADFLQFGEMLLAARRGLGESRSPSETPGLYLEALPFEELDHLELSPEEITAINQLCGLIGLIIIAGWDGWLIGGNGVDRVEFWERHIYFHSADKARIKAAKAIMNDCKCPKIFD